MSELDQTAEKLKASLHLMALVMVGLGMTMVAAGLLSATGASQILSQPADMNEAARWAALAAQGTVHLIMFTMTALVFSSLIEQKQLIPDYLSKPHFPLLPALGFLLVAYFLTAPIIAYTVELNQAMDLPDSLGKLEELMQNMEKNTQEFVQALIRFDSASQFLLGLFVIGVLPAVGEELIFRGIVQRKVQVIVGNGHLAVWITAVVFSAVHFQFYGFLPRMLLGALLGYYYLWSQNLWIPIAAHLINNGFTVIMLYLYQQGISEIDPEQDGLISHWGAIISALLTAALLWLIMKWFGKYRQEPDQNSSASEMPNGD